MRATVGPDVKVKAAGGIRTLDALIEVMNVGTDAAARRRPPRCSTSSAPQGRPARGPSRRAVEPGPACGLAVSGLRPGQRGPDAAGHRPQLGQHDRAVRSGRQRSARARGRPPGAARGSRRRPPRSRRRRRPGPARARSPRCATAMPEVASAPSTAATQRSSPSTAPAKTASTSRATAGRVSALAWASGLGAAAVPAAAQRRRRGPSGGRSRRPCRSPRWSLPSMIEPAADAGPERDQRHRRRAPARAHPRFGERVRPRIVDDRDRPAKPSSRRSRSGKPAHGPGRFGNSGSCRCPRRRGRASRRRWWRRPVRREGRQPASTSAAATASGPRLAWVGRVARASEQRRPRSPRPLPLQHRDLDVRAAEVEPEVSRVVTAAPRRRPAGAPLRTRSARRRRASRCARSAIPSWSSMVRRSLRTTPCGSRPSRRRSISVAGRAETRAWARVGIRPSHSKAVCSEPAARSASRMPAPVGGATTRSMAIGRRRPGGAARRRSPCCRPAGGARRGPRRSARSSRHGAGATTPSIRAGACSR